MISELFLYDQDEGLFKKILEQSQVIQGRYFIVSNGFSINDAALSQITSQKYPCVLLPAPRSTLQPPSFIIESFSFDLYFLARAGMTGQNQILNANADTLTSDHPAWYDWKDMKECAIGFVRMLRELIRVSMVGSMPLKGLVSIDAHVAQTIIRITEAGTDKVSGVKLSLSMSFNNDCSNVDYAGVDPSAIAIPDQNLHPLHKH